MTIPSLLNKSVANAKLLTLRSSHQSFTTALSWLTLNYPRRALQQFFLETITSLNTWTKMMTIPNTVTGVKKDRLAYKWFDQLQQQNRLRNALHLTPAMEISVPFSVHIFKFWWSSLSFGIKCFSAQGKCRYWVLYQWSRFSPLTVKLDFCLSWQGNWVANQALSKEEFLNYFTI